MKQPKIAPELIELYEKSKTEAHVYIAHPNPLNARQQLDKYRKWEANATPLLVSGLPERIFTPNVEHGVIIIRWKYPPIVAGASLPVPTKAEPPPKPVPIPVVKPRKLKKESQAIYDQWMHEKTSFRDYYKTEGNQSLYEYYDTQVIALERWIVGQPDETYWKVVTGMKWPGMGKFNEEDEGQVNVLQRIVFAAFYPDAVVAEVVSRFLTDEEELARKRALLHELPVDDPDLKEERERRILEIEELDRKVALKSLKQSPFG